MRDCDGNGEDNAWGGAGLVLQMDPVVDCVVMCALSSSLSRISCLLKVYDVNVWDLVQF